MTVFCFQQSGYPPLTCNRGLDGCRFYAASNHHELTSILAQLAARRAARNGPGWLDRLPQGIFRLPSMPLNPVSSMAFNAGRSDKDSLKDVLRSISKARDVQLGRRVSHWKVIEGQQFAALYVAASRNDQTGS